MVLFEQGNCHACDLLHSSPLNKPEILDALESITSVQLNMWANTAVVTPDGKATTARVGGKTGAFLCADTGILRSRRQRNYTH